MEECIFNEFLNSITEFLNSDFFFPLERKKSLHFSFSLSIPLSLSSSPLLSQVKEVVADSHAISVCLISQVKWQTGKLGVTPDPSASQIQEHLCLRHVATRGPQRQAV